MAEPFDLDGAWRLDERVSIRPERFGALLYHFGTRRLSFLKSPVLLDVIRGLAEQPSAREACVQAGVRSAELPRYHAALATLAASQMLVPNASLRKLRAEPDATPHAEPDATPHAEPDATLHAEPDASLREVPEEP